MKKRPAKANPKTDAAIAEAIGTVRMQLPKKLDFLLEMHPYKILYGGRGGMKTESIARALLSLAANGKLRILCAREIQDSIADSVHATLKGVIEQYGLTMFRVMEKKIICPLTGSEFIFHGLHGHSVQSIKSFAKLDIVWVEEAHTVSKNSWTVLLPTMREENAEVWVSFNPDMDTDDTWERFVVHPPEGAVVCKLNWRDNKWFPAILEAQRQHALKYYPDEYENIWEGKCRSVVVGAIYAKEVTAMIEEQRYGQVPYDPRFPVHCIWDLGWNDAMSLIMVQKPMPNYASIINYLEGSFLSYPQWIAIRRTLGYVWGDDWLPHDAAQHHPTSGTNAKKQLQGLGCKVKEIPKTNDEARIRAGRMMFPRIYISSTPRAAPPEAPAIYHGGPRLMDCLKRYKRTIPVSTGEPASPKHDAYSHAADAFGGLAEIIDQIRNEADIAPPPTLPAYSNAQPSMGVLG